MKKVKSLYENVGDFDAVVSCAGDATIAPFAALTQDSFMLGPRQKSGGTSKFGPRWTRRLCGSGPSACGNICNDADVRPPRSGGLFTKPVRALLG